MGSDLTAVLDKCSLVSLGVPPPDHRENYSLCKLKRTPPVSDGHSENKKLKRGETVKAESLTEIVMSCRTDKKYLCPLSLTKSAWQVCKTNRTRRPWISNDFPSYSRCRQPKFSPKWTLAKVAIPWHNFAIASERTGRYQQIGRDLRPMDPSRGTCRGVPELSFYGLDLKGPAALSATARVGSFPRNLQGKRKMQKNRNQKYL